MRLWRSIARRCPRCGHAPIFTSFFTLVPACGGCGLRFEREEGYWLGAMIINMAAISVLFLTTMGLGIWLSWPDVPWTALTVGVIALNLLFPIAFYPYSKTLWVAVDLAFRDAAGEHDD